MSNTHRLDDNKAERKRCQDAVHEVSSIQEACNIAADTNSLVQVSDTHRLDDNKNLSLSDVRMLITKWVASERYATLWLTPVCMCRSAILTDLMTTRLSASGVRMLGMKCAVAPWMASL